MLLDNQPCNELKIARRFYLLARIGKLAAAPGEEIACVLPFKLRGNGGNGTLQKAAVLAHALTVIRYDLHDERYEGIAIEVAFAGTLRIDQEAAVAAMLHHDAGVLCAPTAFGKTATAAAIIAQRGINIQSPRPRSPSPTSKRP